MAVSFTPERRQLAPPLPIGSDPATPMGDREFRAALEVAVRAGVVSAMKLWSDLYATPVEAPAPAPSAISRLAARGDAVSSLPGKFETSEDRPPARVHELARRRVDLPRDPDTAAS
jgi:hypothetical protein